jgi:cytochrome c5
MRKLLFAVLAAVSVNAVAADKAVVDRYNQACIACHASGAAGAPKFGNAADWAPRLAKGIDKLLVSTKNGLNAMPPKGLCMNCSDADFKALIQYMSTGK